MKKTIILSAIMAFSTSIFSAETPSLKPSKGTITSQVGMSFASFNNNVTSLGLNGRYFFKDQLALRLGIMIDNQKSVDNTAENANGTGGTGSFTTNNNGNMLLLGIEKHFNGNRRLSPYAGVEIGFGSSSIKTEGVNFNNSIYIDNYTENAHRKFSDFGINAFLGFDYWFTEGVYVGIEYTFAGYFSSKEKQSETVRKTNNNTVTTVNFENSISDLSTISALPVFRLGWRFN
jgi:outer membrane protein W